MKKYEEKQENLQEKVKNKIFMSKKVNKKHIGVEKYNRILQMLIANARKNDTKYVLKDFQLKASELYGG